MDFHLQNCQMLLRPRVFMKRVVYVTLKQDDISVGSVSLSPGLGE